MRHRANESGVVTATSTNANMDAILSRIFYRRTISVSSVERNGQTDGLDWSTFSLVIRDIYIPNSGSPLHESVRQTRFTHCPQLTLGFLYQGLSRKRLGINHNGLFICMMYLFIYFSRTL